MHPSHRTWFPHILIGLSVLLALGIYAWVQGGRALDTGSVIENEQVAVTEEEYESEIATVMSGFISSNNAEEAYAELLDTRVPSGYKELHLELVIIMSKYKSGVTDEAQARYELLKAQYNWLP